MARSGLADPGMGHARPAPSPTQNVPTAESSTPSRNFSVFSGTRASGRCSTRPSAATTSSAATAPRPAGRNSPRSSCSERKDDEDHLGPFEHGDVKGSAEGKLVPPRNTARVGLAHGRSLLCESGPLIVQRNQAGRAQDGLAQPAQAKQQNQCAHDELHHVKWDKHKPVKRNARERGAEHPNDGGEQGERNPSTGKHAAPAAPAADRQH